MTYGYINPNEIENMSKIIDLDLNGVINYNNF